MTNEELVTKIQSGKTELMSELWTQVERFVRQQAYKFATGDRWSDLCKSAGLTDEDFYIVGYFALEKAVKEYDADREASFLTYFGNFHLKRAFYKELGVNNSGGKYRVKPNLLSQAESLDKQIFEGKDGNKLTLESHLADESAQEPFEQIEDVLYNQQLHADLEEALASLRPRDAQIIRDNYYNMLSLVEQEKKYGISKTRIRDIRQRALLLLRKHRKLKEYKARFIGSTNFTGYQAWKDSGMSQPERLVIIFDEYERRFNLKG